MIMYNIIYRIIIELDIIIQLYIIVKIIQCFTYGNIIIIIIIHLHTK